jgi:hypothetical protein
MPEKQKSCFTYNTYFCQSKIWVPDFVHFHIFPACPG